MENKYEPDRYELHGSTDTVYVAELTAPVSKKRRSWHTAKIVSLIIALIIVIAGVCVYSEYQNYEYVQQIAATADTMLAAAAKSEECGELILNVWYNAIYEKSDPKTDKFTKTNGYFVSDFNDALTALAADDDFNNELNKMRDYQDKINTLMGEIKNPPSRYEALYVQIQNLYNDYIDLNVLVLMCNGSYNSFSDDFNSLLSDIVKDYNKIQQYFS